MKRGLGIFSDSPLRLGAVVFFVAFLLGIPTLRFGLVFDDISRLAQNETIRSLSNLWLFFERATWPGNLYRPLEEISYSLTYSMVGLNPFLFHLTNVVLHALCSLVLFFLVFELWGIGRAFYVSLLFAVLPIHSEVIANISYRTESLSALFLLCSGFFAIRLFKLPEAGFRKRWEYVRLLFVSVLFGLLAKESGIHVLLLAPLVVVFSRPEKISKSSVYSCLLAVIAAVGLYFFLRYNALGGSLFIEKAVKPHDNPLVKLDTPMRIWNSVLLMSRYFVLSIVPFHVSAVSSFPKMIPVLSVGATSILSWILLTSFLFVFVVALIFRRRSSVLLFWCLWFLSCLAITSNILLPIGTIFADRLNYLASAAACGVFVEAVFYLKNISLRRTVLGGLAICYAVLSQVQMVNWQSNYTLFESEVSKSPRNSLAHRILRKGIVN